MNKLDVWAVEYYSWRGELMHYELHLSRKAAEAEIKRQKSIGDDTRLERWIFEQD